MIKISSVIMFSLILINCSNNHILKEPYFPFEINKNYLVVHSIVGNEIKIKGSAKYSVINILRKYNLFPSDSLWCIIKYDEDNKDAFEGLPDSLVEILINKYHSYEIKEGPHYELYFRNSNIDKQKAIEILKNDSSSFDRKILFVSTKIYWDIYIHINKEKNGVTKIEKGKQ